MVRLGDTGVEQEVECKIFNPSIRVEHDLQLMNDEQFESCCLSLQKLNQWEYLDQVRHCGQQFHLIFNTSSN